MTAPTSRKLAGVLRKAGLHDLARRAEADEFHDFLSNDPLCSITLDNELVKIINDENELPTLRLIVTNIRNRHHNGDFDASTAESEEWAKSAEGRDAFNQLLKDLDKK